MGEPRKLKNRKFAQSKFVVPILDTFKQQIKEPPLRNETLSQKLFTTEGFEYRNLRTQRQRELMNKSVNNNYNVPSMEKLIDTMNLLNDVESKEPFVMRKQQSFPSISDVISNENTNKSKKNSPNKRNSSKKRQKICNKKPSKRKSRISSTVFESPIKQKNTRNIPYLELSKTQGNDDSPSRKKTNPFNNNKYNNYPESATQKTDIETRSYKEKNKETETFKTPIIPLTLDRTNNSSLHTQEEH